MRRLDRRRACDRTIYFLATIVNFAKINFFA